MRIKDCVVSLVDYVQNALSLVFVMLVSCPVNLFVLGGHTEIHCCVKRKVVNIDIIIVCW